MSRASPIKASSLEILIDLASVGRELLAEHQRLSAHLTIAYMYESTVGTLMMRLNDGVVEEHVRRQKG